MQENNNHIVFFRLPAPGASLFPSTALPLLPQAWTFINIPCRASKGALTFKPNTWETGRWACDIPSQKEKTMSPCNLQSKALFLVYPVLIPSHCKKGGLLVFIKVRFLCVTQPWLTSNLFCDQAGLKLTQIRRPLPPTVLEFKACTTTVRQEKALCLVCWF